MNNENGVRIQNGILFSCEENGLITRGENIMTYKRL